VAFHDPDMGASLTNQDAVSLEFQDVSFRYPGAEHTAVAGLDFRLDRGELLACIGPSGSGKTTLLRLAAGLEVPHRGRVTVAGHSVHELAPAERQVGLVAQESPVYPGLSVADNIALPLRSRGIAASQVRERVRQALESVGIEHLSEKRADRLSGGERQRVALARVLGWSPQILCLDEPLSSVDAAIRPGLLRLIRDTHDRLSSVTLFITHVAADALAIADRVLVMRDGRQLQIGSPQEVYRAPVHLDVVRLLWGGSANRLQARVLGVTPSGEVELLMRELRVQAAAVERIGHALPEQIELALRAEELVLGPGSIDERLLRLPARVLRALYHGEGYILECDSAVGILAVWSISKCTPGECVQIQFPPGGIRMFDAASGASCGKLRLGAQVA